MHVLIKVAHCRYVLALAPDHPDVATSLNNLALLYQAQGRYGATEPPQKQLSRCAKSWQNCSV